MTLTVKNSLKMFLTLDFQSYKKIHQFELRVFAGLSSAKSQFFMQNNIGGTKNHTKFMFYRKKNLVINTMIVQRSNLSLTAC